MPEAAVLLGIITLGAAIVNGGLGYGFSSLTVPLALLFMTNRVLNPALVLLEVPLNGYVLFVNRHSITDVWRRVLPVVIALGPGIAIGTSVVASVSTAWVKIGTYVVLLPLILAQAAGYRRPVQSQRIAGLVFGGCLGVLYSVTTISGPPLAIALSNQGLAKQEFRAALGVIRLAESSLTAVAYLYAGMITRQRCTGSVHASECPHRRATGGCVGPPSSPRNVPSDLHEFRRVDCGLRSLSPVE